MKERKKWSVKDVITTVLLSAVLIVIQLLVNMVCMVNDFVSMVLSVGIAAFLGNTFQMGMMPGGGIPGGGGMPGGGGGGMGGAPGGF